MSQIWGEKDHPDTRTTQKTKQKRPENKTLCHAII